MGDTFKKRTGTTDKGKIYEDLITANYAFNLLLDKTKTNFKLSSNNEQFGAFDDVVIEIESQTYAIQLKHKNNETQSWKALKKKDDFSLKKYYDSYNKEINQSCQVILFTNSDFDLDEGEEILFANNILKIKKCDLDKLISETGSCYKFEVTYDEKSKFFDNFFLYTKQTNVCKIRDKLRNQFGEIFGLEESENYKKFVDFIVEWSGIEEEKPKLDRFFIERVITLLLLKPFIEPIRFGCKVNTNAKFLRDVISERKVTVFDQRVQTQVATLWGDAKITLDIKEVNKMRQKYQICDYINDFRDINDKDQSIFLWLMKKTPLILHGGEVVNKVIKLCKMKKFVVLETAGEWIKLTDLSGLKSYEFVLTSFKCCFQGKETQCLRDFTDLIPFWTLNELVLMLDGPYTLDRKETLTHSYINRRLTRHVVDITYLDKIDKNTSVLIDCVNTDLKCLCVDLDQFLNGDSNLEKKFLHFGAVFIKKTPCGSDDFDNLCRKTNSRKSLHFRMDENNLDLIRSKGETDLERFCLNVSIEEDKLLERLGNNINLIINEAGMGKTELLKHWKNEFFEDYWTLLLTPKDMSCVSEHIEGFFDYIVKEKYRDLQDFDKNVLEVFLKKNRVVYLWDALDEISTQNQDKIINLIKKLPRECQQWVTSRPHLKPKLETAFGVPARHLLPLDRDQQIFYIEQVLKWDIGPKMINSDIFAVPLHLFMVSELWQDSQKYQNLSLIDLYRNFIENKKKKLCEKAKLETPNDCLWELFDQNVDDMLEAYEQIAFKSLLSEDLIKKLNINCDHCFKKIKKWKDRLGLLSHFDDSSAQFLHISFAEYLVARYFSTNFEHISHLEFIFLQEFQNVRFFFDLLLAQESQLHVAVLYKDYEFLKQNEDQVRTCRDFGGRNLLQLACSWGQTCPELSVEKVGDVYVIDDQNDLNEITDSQDYVKIVKFLLEICDIEETDCVFKMNTRGYADRANCVLAKIFIEKKKRSCGNILSSRTLCNLLYFSARFGCSETLEVCEKIPIVQTKSKNSLLHLVTSESYLSQLLNKKEYKKLINQVNKFGETPLLVASTNGYDTIVRNLIQSGAMIDICDNDGFSPLHKSCRVGHHNIVDILIQKGAQIDICDKDGDTPLHLAAYHGHDNITEMLILTKTKLDVCDNDGSTPLHKAAYNGHNDVMRRLIESGSQIDVCDHFGRTPLYWAAHNGHVKTVKILIDNGAQIDICDKNNESALYLAAFNGHYDVIQNLLSHGKSQIDVCDDDGSRPLHKAAYNGHERVVTALISLGVQIDSCDKFGRTPLYWAAHNGYVKTVKILIDKGARIDICDKKDGSPLHVAAYNGHDHVVNLISSTIIDNCDRDGSTPLHKACYNGHIKVVDTLLSKGAKIDSCDNYNRTPLYWAAHNGHHKVTNFLIVSGANIDICDHGRWSPLIWAIYNGHKEVVSDLLSGGANVQIWTNEGETPLHKACVKGYSEIAKMLILKGAEIDICDNCGRTPLDIAMQRGFDNVVSLLITSGAKVDPLKYRL